MKVILLTVFSVVLFLPALLPFHRRKRDIFRNLFWCALSVPVFWYFGWGYQPGQLVVSAILLLAWESLSVSDFREKSVDSVRLFLFFIAVVLSRSFVTIPLWPNLLSVLTAVSFLGIPFLMTRGKAMGAGDVIVFSLTAVLMNPFETLIAGTMAAVLGSAYGIGTGRDKRIPFIPFLQAGFYMIKILGNYFNFPFS